MKLINDIFNKKKNNVAPPQSDVFVSSLIANFNCYQTINLPSQTLASLPWIKLVDDAFEPDHGEKSGAESCQTGQKKNAKRE